MAVSVGDAEAFDARVAETLPRLAAAVPAFARRLEAAGLAANELRDVAALSRLPVLTKDDLVALQATT